MLKYFIPTLITLFSVLPNMSPHSQEKTSNISSHFSIGMSLDSTQFVFRPTDRTKDSFLQAESFSFPALGNYHFAGCDLVFELMGPLDPNLEGAAWAKFHLSYGDSVLLAKDSLQAVSPFDMEVLNGDTLLTFMLYEHYGEYHHTGSLFVINLSRKSVKTYKKTITNTSGPIISNGYIYVIDELNLYQLDLNLADPPKVLNIMYKPQKGSPYAWLDTYRINKIAYEDSQFFIGFAPDPYRGHAIIYSGKINFEEEKVIWLIE